MRIITVGCDARSLQAKAYLEGDGRVEKRDGTMIILPVPSTRDGEYVSGCSVPLSNVASELSEGDIAVGYGLPEHFVCACFARGGRVIDIAADSEYVSEGAYLTAMGCIGYLLDKYTESPRELSFGIIGLGRIGAYLAGALLALGGRVRAFSSKGRSNSGVEILPYGALLEEGAVSGLRVLINTAPARLIPNKLAAALSHCEVIELASGDNIPEEIECTRLPSLPARAFPISAGNSVGRAILRGLFPEALS